MQEDSSEITILELANTVEALKKQVADLTARVENHATGLRVLKGAYESLSDYTFEYLGDIRERVRMLEPAVFPHLPAYRQEIDRITKPPQQSENDGPLRAPPSLPRPSSKR